MEIKVGANQDVEIIEEDDGKRTVRITDKPGVEIASLHQGDTFIMADHEWIVLDENIETTCNWGVGVISKDFYTTMAFGSSKKFSESSVDAYLRDVVLPKITHDINRSVVSNGVSFRSLDGQIEFFRTSRFIRLITYDEARKYNHFLVNEDLEDEWWTCTPWSTNNRGRNYDMVTIDPSGIISKANCKQEECGVRPFCVLDPNTIVRLP